MIEETGSVLIHDNHVRIFLENIGYKCCNISAITYDKDARMDTKYVRLNGVKTHISRLIRIQHL